MLKMGMFLLYALKNVKVEPKTVKNMLQFYVFIIKVANLNLLVSRKIFQLGSMC